MIEAVSLRARRRSPEFLGSPDMVAFTVGQIALASIAEDGEISLEAVRRYLSQIASGTGQLTTRVNTDMALEALCYIDASLRAAGK